eukprot:GSMAST32.ASY1.ANO1.1391.1 assembled CDS
MVASAVFIMDLKGKIIISPTTRFHQIVQESDQADLKPVFTVDGITYVYIKFNNLLLLAVTKRNANVTIILLFLNRLVNVFKEYFGDIHEESIRDNFVIIYELFDEMMDFGYPQSTEPKVLKEYITQESHRTETKPPTTLTNAVSWRSEGIKHRKNEIFLDVIEKLNLLVATNGTVLHSEILGEIKMKSFLSGMPELKLGLNDKIMSMLAKGKAVEMEDIKTISFIPPDGEFELMSYRLNTHVKPLIWVEALAKSQFKSRSIANGVEIRIAVPTDVDTPSFKASVGTVTYVPDQDCIVWSIKQFYGSREYLMRAHFGLPSIKQIDDDQKNDSWKAPIQVNFEIPYFTVSGIQVRYLKIIEKSGYQALPWVRYITKNGKYQLRMS